MVTLDTKIFISVKYLLKMYLMVVVYFYDYVTVLYQDDLFSCGFFVIYILQYILTECSQR